MSIKGEEQPEIIIEEQEGSYCTNCMINFFSVWT